MSTKSQFPVLLRVDISESETAFHVEANLAGFRAENVSVKTWQDSLVIEIQSTQVQGQSYYLGELEPESYQRVIPLGFTLKDDQVHTHFNNETLSISVRKPANMRAGIRSSRLTV